MASNDNSQKPQPNEAALKALKKFREDRQQGFVPQPRQPTNKRTSASVMLTPYEREQLLQDAKRSAEYLTNAFKKNPPAKLNSQ